MFKIDYYHKRFGTATENIAAMNWVKGVVADIDFPGIAFAMSQTYSRWEIDEVNKTTVQKGIYIRL